VGTLHARYYDAGETKPAFLLDYRGLIKLSR